MKQVFLSLLVLSVLGLPTSFADDGPTAEELERGKTLAFDRAKGNCLACHAIEGGELAGNYGPPLMVMQARFPDRSVLRAQIWDASIRFSETRMPPYGRHRILTEEEIDLIVDFIHTL